MDLLNRGSPVVSLRDASASIALGRLRSFPLEQPEDIYEVGETIIRVGGGGGADSCLI